MEKEEKLVVGAKVLKLRAALSKERRRRKSYQEKARFHRAFVDDLKFRVIRHLGAELGDEISDTSSSDSESEDGDVVPPPLQVRYADKPWWVDNGNYQYIVLIAQTHDGYKIDKVTYGHIVCPGAESKLSLSDVDASLYRNKPYATVYALANRKLV